jgi:hypothetical protein
VIITISTPDEFYFNQLLAFLASLNTNSPNQEVYIQLVDYPAKKMYGLQHAFPDYLFLNTSVKKIDERGIEFILLRIDLIRSWFKQMGVKAISWIDTDVIVRGDLSNFIYVKPNQLKILYRGDYVQEKVRFNAGIFSIGNSKPTLEFVNRWYGRLEDNAKWGMGQLELYRTYKEFKNKIELIRMDQKYNDLGGADRPNAFSNESIMWHCKQAHFNHPKFQKEFQKYLKLGKEIYNGS